MVKYSQSQPLDRVMDERPCARSEILRVYLPARAECGDDPAPVTTMRRGCGGLGGGNSTGHFSRALRHDALQHRKVTPEGTNDAAPAQARDQICEAGRRIANDPIGCAPGKLAQPLKDGAFVQARPRSSTPEPAGRRRP